MNHLLRKPWAKLLSNNPDKDTILLFSHLEELYEGQIKTGCQIHQKSGRDAWIKNLSASAIKIDDNWLEAGEEKEISNGERLSFNKDREHDNADFDYVFILMDVSSKNPNKRVREDASEASTLISSPEANKLVKIGDELEEELTCPICKRIIHNCVTLEPCDHIFCSFCLLQSLKVSLNCPSCRTQATGVKKNLTERNMVTLILKNFPEKERSKEEIDQRNIEVEGTVVKERDGIYIGAYKDGKREGRGSLIYSKGKIYEGFWKNGKREGKGTLIFQNGEIYKGEWLNDEMQKEAEILTKQGIYKGDVLNLTMHGKGVFKWKNGDIYEGDFVKGLQEGFGTLKKSNGIFYEGQWKNDQKNGAGVGIFLKGDRYEGLWVRDVCHGKGQCIWPDGSKYEGNWVDGRQSGDGTMTLPNGEVYKCKWKAGKKSGEGVWTLSNGDKYEGVWTKDVLKSVRRVSYANGDIYEGGVQVDSLQKHGKGVLTYKNGDKYEGSWVNGKQHGKGKEIRRNDNRVFEGSWEEGSMVGEIIMTDASGARYKAEWKRLE